MLSLFVPRPPASRPKLGLSLAGGGFRASLFHIGVLRRLAEMDMLRYVEVLSTVSGGSIVGALYILMLKKRLDAKASITRDEYVQLVKDLEKDFVAGVQKDLRTRLLMNPLGMLSVLLSHDGLGRRMGRIYQRYLYTKAVNALGFIQTNPLHNLLWPGWMPLPKVRFTQPMPEGIEEYNKQARSHKGSVVPNFIMNSTALNSGAVFRFSSSEIGDPRLGYFRYDEIDFLAARKTLLDMSPEDLATMAKQPSKLPIVKGHPLDARVATLVQWWLIGNPDPSKQYAPARTVPTPDGWTLFQDDEFTTAAESMCKTNFGRLRQLKLAAWYIRKGLQRQPPIKGGLDEPEHRQRFVQVLKEAEPRVNARVVDAINKANTSSQNDVALGGELLDFAIEIYYLRSAEVMSWRLQDDFESVSLGTAVAASANFPPVFPPLMLLGIYDDLHVARLGLSDGGVYDNTGITTLVEEGCTDIIASDTGAPFDVKQRVSSRYLGMIGRLPDILMEDVAEQQRTQVRNRARLFKDLSGLQNVQNIRDQYGLDGLAFFSVDSLNPPGPGGIDTGCISFDVATLRTDLDAFGDMEVAALINAGYDHTDRFVRAHLSKAPYLQPCWDAPVPAPPCPPKDKAAYEHDIPRVLAVGQSRLFRSLLLRSIPSWLFVFAIGVLVYFLGQAQVSIESLVMRIPSIVLNRFENPFPLFGWLGKQHPLLLEFASLNGLPGELVKLELPFWSMLLLAIALLLAMFMIWPQIAAWLRRNRGSGKRKVVTGAKWLRAFAPALFLLAGLTPIYIAGVACVIGCVSYVFFNKPFLRATKMK
jgi:predicted acylesterase/phospholipase RssA